MKKLRKPDARDGWYELTPGDAQAFLDAQPLNRPLRESKAIRFAVDIEAGKWRANGEPLILDETDRLLDGQGRCRACVIAGKPVEVYVIHNIPRRFFSTVDTGQVRGAADTLALRGTKNYAVAAAVARLAIVCSMGTPTSHFNRPIPNWQIDEWTRKNTERLAAAMDELTPIWHKSPLMPSLLVYVFMEALDIDPVKAKKWAFGVALGEDLKAGSPMLALRNRLIALKGEAGKAATYEKLAWAIKSWNAFAAGSSVTTLKWLSRNSGRGAESFPQVMAP